MSDVEANRDRPQTPVRPTVPSPPKPVDQSKFLTNDDARKLSAGKNR